MASPEGLPEPAAAVAAPFMVVGNPHRAHVKFDDEYQATVRITPPFTASDRFLECHTVGDHRIVGYAGTVSASVVEIANMPPVARAQAALDRNSVLSVVRSLIGELDEIECGSGEWAGPPTEHYAPV